VYSEEHSWYRRHRLRLETVAKKEEEEMKELLSQSKEEVEEGETMGCVFAVLDDDE
jgi:hypothetical protein